MLTTAKILLQEHEKLEQLLIELETIMSFEELNYPNLIHTLREIISVLDSHEDKEEIYFSRLLDKGFTIPVKKITFEHGILKRDREALINAINSGNEFLTKEKLKTNGADLIKIIRAHLKTEDWIFYALPKSYLV